jgi:tRNA threonylcarbamoyl adenosine modification protein (Sua5/YciO/YrdC/YwlC family)
MLRLVIHPENPQPRLIKRAVEILRSGGLVIYPTDTTYGLGCDFFSKRAIERIYQLKGLDAKHPLSFLCSDLSEVARYGVVENHNYRILRHHTPGRYTFVLPATREVPKIVASDARTVGVRIPHSAVAIALIRELGHPIMSTTVTRQPTLAGPYNDPDEIEKHFGRSVEALCDSGPLFGEPSSVIDLTQQPPVIIREGSGDLSWLKPTPRS